MDWARVDVWQENADGRSPAMTGVIATDGGFIAWGPTTVGSGIVVSSNALHTWSQAGERGQFDGVRIAAIAEGPAGTVAIGGTKAGTTRLWRSPDGMTWTGGPRTTGIDGTVADLAVIGRRYVAAGSAKGGCDVAVWLSNDGLTWQPSEPLTGAKGTCTKGEVSVGPTISSLEPGPGGLVAYGSVPGVGTAFWTSTDGTRWAFHPQPSVGGNIVRFTAGGPGYVAVGNTGTPNGAAWTSPDGATWTSVPDAPSFHGAEMSDVAALADGTLVAVGSDLGNHFTAWTSPDGVAWVRASAASTPPSGLETDFTTGWLATDGTLLVAVAGGPQAWVSPPLSPGD